MIADAWREFVSMGSSRWIIVAVLVLTFTCSAFRKGGAK